MVGVRDLYYLEIVDAVEDIGVACVDRKAVGDSDRRDHGVVGSSRRLSSRTPQ